MLALIGSAYSQGMNRGLNTLNSSLNIAGITGSDTSLYFSFTGAYMSSGYSIQVISNDTVIADDIVGHFYVSNSYNCWIAEDTVTISEDAVTYDFDYIEGTTFPWSVGKLKFTKGSLTRANVDIKIYCY
jgi:hypothetical protein